MDDIDQLLQAYDNANAEQKKCALATLVHVSGAAFRKVGSRMLIDSDGHATGAITAGCIEADIVDKSRHVLLSGDPLIVRYDTGSEKEIFFGWGSGCDGVLTVLIERLSQEADEGVLSYLKECRAAGTVADVATIFAGTGCSTTSQLGQHLVDEEARTLFSARSGEESDMFPQSITLEQSGGSIDILFERIAQPNHLYIFGDGAVATPLANLADETGWRVTVIDKKEPDRSGTSDSVRSLCLPYETFLEHIALDYSSAVVILTHNFLDDSALIVATLATPVRMVSVLSSQRRAAKLLEFVTSQQGNLSPNDLSRLYIPAGLDIGGNTPAQIALSILAQIQLVFTNSSGIALREKAQQ